MSYRLLTIPFAALLIVFATGCQQKKSERITAKNSRFQADETDDSLGGGRTPRPMDSGPSGRRPTTGAELTIPKSSLPSTPPRGTDPAPVEPGGAPGAQPVSPGAAQANNEPPTRPQAGGAASPNRPRSPGVSVPSAGVASPRGGQPAPAIERITMEKYDPPLDVGPKKLIEHISKLSRAIPKGRREDEQLQDMHRIYRARILTAELLLASPDATDDEKLMGAEIKLESMGILGQLGVSEVVGHTRQFAAALQQHEVKPIAEMGRLITFGIRTGDLTTKKTADPAWVMEELRAILRDMPLTPKVLNFTREAAKRLGHTGHEKEGLIAAKLVIRKFEDHADPDIVQAVDLFREETLLAEHGLMPKLNAAVKGLDGAEAELVSTIKQLVALKDQVGRPSLAALLQCGLSLEYGRRYSASKQVYDAIEEGFKDRKDPDMVDFMGRLIQKARKRLAIVGKPLPLEGTTLDSQPIDLSRYEGKIVLVDFWASWYFQQFPEELPLLKAAHQRFDDQGFEILGFNLDDDPRALQAFLAENEIPWKSLGQQDPKLRGLQRDPRAQDLGVDALPFRILIGRDGKVIDVHLSGAKIQNRLGQLFAEEKKAREAKP